MNIKKILISLMLTAGLVFTVPIYADSILSPMTDSVNSGIINTKMYTDKSLSNISIDATVINGVAIYSGEVHSKAQLDELVRIARSVSGIKGVDVSKVKIKP